jgi:prepilin peptidase CpaA
MHIGYDLAACVAVFSAVAAVLDYRTKKIPNWLTVPAAALGLAYNCLAPGGIGPLTAMLGLLIGFSLLILPWLLGGGGMGDVKLLAALGAWLGPVLILISFGLAAVLAAGGAIAIMAGTAMSEGFSTARRRYVQSAGCGTAACSGSAPPRKVRRVLPFAVPVALGTWLVLTWMLLRSQGL